MAAEKKFPFQVLKYLFGSPGSVFTLTSSSGVASPDANNGVSQKFPLTENVNSFTAPANLADGKSMSISVIQSSTPYTLTLGSGFVPMSGQETDIAGLAQDEIAEITIKRVGGSYLIWITPQL